PTSALARTALTGAWPPGRGPPAVPTTPGMGTRAGVWRSCAATAARMPCGSGAANTGRAVGPVGRSAERSEQATHKVAPRPMATRAAAREEVRVLLMKSLPVRGEGAHLPGVTRKIAGPEDSR